MHTMCKSGKQQYEAVDNRQLCTQAISLHQTWHPACPHQGHTGDSCPSQVEACVMHTVCESGKRHYKVVDESALCPKATSLHQTWHPASPYQGHTLDNNPWQRPVSCACAFVHNLWTSCVSRIGCSLATLLF